jgi:hypothetical protein
LTVPFPPPIGVAGDGLEEGEEEKEEGGEVKGEEYLARTASTLAASASDMGIGEPSACPEDWSL